MAWKAYQQSADRRLDRLEKVLAAPARVHFVWQGEDETREQVEAKMRAMIANGKKPSPRDRLSYIDGKHRRMAARASDPGSLCVLLYFQWKRSLEGAPSKAKHDF